MTRIKIKIIVVLASLTIFGSGCSVVGPDYQKPNEKKLLAMWDANLSRSDANVKEWWKLFNDTTLNTLVEKTYEENLDLRSAGLRILQSRAALGISEGMLYPQAQSLSGSLAAIRNGSKNFTAAGASFDVGWEMDIWGKYARGIESSEASLYASVASYDDILVSVIAEVARNYISYRTAQERMAYAERNIAIQKKITKMTEVQFNAGNVTELDMQQAKTQLYNTESSLPMLQLSEIKARNALAVLLGILPQELDEILKKEQKKENDFIPTIKIADNFKIAADVVRRRPDLRVAELQARAQNARIGAAEAELYPHFSLFGTLGYNTNSATNNWVSAGDAIGISVGPAFSWNILHYGRIKNQVRIEDARFQESLINYNKKVILAVQEVSNALHGYKLTKEQLELNEKAITATTRAYELSVVQYENGLVSYQRLLSTVEKLTKTEDVYAQIKGNIDIQAIALYKALGGGWDIKDQKNYIHKKDRDAMKKRGVEWGKYLEQSNVK